MKDGIGQNNRPVQYFIEILKALEDYGIDMISSLLKEI